MVGAFDEDSLKDGFHDGWDFAAEELAFAFGAERVTCLYCVTLLKPYFDAICAEGVLAACLLTACHWLPHDVMAD